MIQEQIPMSKGLMTKFLAFLFLFFALINPLNALEITGIEKEKDGEITLSFCNTFKIENIALNQSSLAQAAVLPKDEEIYENLALLNADIAGKIVSCFGVCELKAKCKNVPYTLDSIRKIKDKDLFLAKVVFDRDISAIFLVSTYKKKDKILYRVKTPQDFKFLNKKYRKNFRTWLIKEIKNKYEMF